MKKVLFVSFVLLFTASLWSESVTEVAKKEKARREALAKQGKKATVLTNKDVPNIKSSLGIESTSTGQSGEGSTDDITAAIQQATDNSSAELEELKQQREDLNGKLQEVSDSIDQGTYATNIGDRYKEKRLTEEELANVDAQIKAIEAKRQAAAEQQAQKPPPEEQPAPEQQPASEQKPAEEQTQTSQSPN